MKSLKLSPFIYPASFAILILLVWDTVTSTQMTLTWILPSPMSILKVFYDYPDLLLSHSLVTMVETIIGLTLSIIMGVILAVGMNSFTFVRRTLYPYMIISQTIPIIALAPLMILWLGYGITAKIFIVALVCFFPIAVNLFDGFNQVNIEHLRLFKSLRANTWQTFRLLKFPSALPAFFTGLKLAVSYSIMAAIIGEWLGGEKGLGIYMTRATKSYQTAHVFAIVILISLFSLLLYGVVVFLERILLSYRFIRSEEYIDAAPPQKR